MMKLIADQQLLLTFAGVLGLLLISSAIGLVLKLRVQTDSGRETVGNLNARIRSWWIMCVVFAATLVSGGLGSQVLFALLSFLALREYVTLIPTRREDHRALFWTFFIFTPIQYLLVSIRWYGLFAILIPVYAFLIIPSRIAIAGNTQGFLERAARIQWGLMICTYCLSHAPALLMLQIPGYTGQNVKLLLFLVVVDQISDVLQYVWGKLAGRHKIAPAISPNKTLEGFVGGTASAIAIGTSLWWLTPFTPAAAAGMSLAITSMGFAGGLVFSAIKRDRGVKDYGTILEGHGGILDRIDSLCFAAPVFFHFIRYFYATAEPPFRLW
jgi:phosphatidate cytidylyltransferase